MENEILTNKKILEKITGKKHNLFRFPFGSFNDTAIEVCEKLGVVPVQWDVDSYDSKGIKATDVINRILSRVKGGSIVLMHNNSDYITQVVPVLLERLAIKGFKACKVGDIVLTENFVIDRFGVQHKDK